jgi:hypothetical protein
MYSLFSNEKLGMPVEELRLREIRQDIEARRLAGEVRDSAADVEVNPAGRWFNQVKAMLVLPRWGTRQPRGLHRAG